MTKGTFRLLALVVVSGLLGMFAVACGDDDNGGDSDSGAAVEAGGGARGERAEEAARDAAAEAGGPVELPNKTIGVINIVGGIESSDRVQLQIERAADVLGWETLVCDGQGDPTKMARCGNSLLDRNVAAILAIGVEPSLVAQPLQRSERENIPWIQVSGAVAPDPAMDGSFHPDEALSGRVLAEYVAERLEEVEGDKPVAINDYPAAWSQERTDELRKVLKNIEGAEIVADQTTDATDLVNATRRQTRDALTQNPDLKAYWFGFDAAGQAGASVIAEQTSGEEFPEKPLVVTFHGDQATLDLIRQGTIDAVVDVPYDLTAWYGVDALAEYFARDTPIPDAPQGDYPLAFIDREIVTPENVPPEGEYRQPQEDAITFFETKWQEEFGVGGGNGESAEGESAEGESAEGESAEGESAE